MSGLLSISIDQIIEGDLLELVEVKRVREHVGLDYKSASYSHTHAGAVNLLADVTAMANSRGGYILIGVEEDRNAPDGTPNNLNGIENGDVEATWIQSICLSSIDERIPGLRIRDIHLTNGYHCIVIQIPNSPKKPHMVVHERHRSFHMRHGRSNTLIGMQEVRSMILEMSTYQTAIVNFLEKRIQANQIVSENDPFLLLMATPLYIGSDKIDPLEPSYLNLLENVPGILDPNFEGIRVGRPKPRIFGIEAIPYGRSSNGKYLNFLRLFRNAHFEYYEKYTRYLPNEWPDKAMPIDSYRIAVTLLHFLSVSKQIQDLAQFTEPIVVSLILGNSAPSFLHPWPRTPSRLDNIFVWTDPILKLDVLANELSEPNRVADDLLDLLFNAYGYDQNSHIDDNNHLKMQRF